MLPWLIIGGLVAAVILKCIFTSNTTTTTFSGLTDQRGTFGTNSGLYGDPGAAVAGQAVSA